MVLTRSLTDPGYNNPSLGVAGRSPRSGARRQETLTKVFIASILLSGFINLIPLRLGTNYPATLLTDGSACAMLISLILTAAAMRGRGQLPLWVSLSLFIAATYFALVPNSIEPFPTQFADIRTRIGYFVAGAYIYVFFKDIERLRRLTRYASSLGGFVAIVGLIQYLAGSRLPVWLRAARGEEVFVYYGTGISRANGLVGNTIVFSGVMLIFFCISFSGWVESGRLRDFFKVLLFSAAILASLSRMTIACAAIATILILFFHWRGSRSRRRALVITGSLLYAMTVLLVGLAATQRFRNLATQSFIVSGLFGGANISVNQSTNGHLAQIQAAAHYFLAHPLIGIGTSTQRAGSFWSGSHPIVTDGAIWLLLAENGLIIALPTGALLINIAIVMRSVVRSGSPLRTVSAGALAFFIVQIAIASWVNSAAVGKPVMGLTAIFFGISAAAQAISRRGECSLPPSECLTRRSGLLSPRPVRGAPQGRR